MGKSASSLLPAGLILLALTATVRAGEAVSPAVSTAHVSSPRLALEIGAEAFRWQEFDDQGRRLLTEQGLRYAVAGSWHSPVRIGGGTLYSVTLRGYAGDVDYDGQDTSRRFVGTTTEYRGYGVEANAGYRWARSRGPLELDVIAGIGLDRWERNIRGGVNAAGFAVAGFLEDYTITYGRLGLGLSHRAGAPRGHLGIGYRFPLITREDVVVAGQALELEPGKRGSAWIAYKISLHPGVSRRDFGTYVRISYDSYRFGRSASQVVGDHLVWQPESNMDVLGVMLGFSY